MKKRIAFFDFDGTITTKDSLLEFIRFSKGSRRFLSGFLWNSAYLFAYKLKIISNQLAKEKILQFFFKDMPLEDFTEQCNLFSKNILPGLIRPKAIEEIKKLQENNTIIVVVSASPENWIRKWADDMHLQLIGSLLEVKEGKLTGKIVGKNCHGAEKVQRIMQNHQTGDYEEIYVYGDSSGDREMLSLATNRFYKPFRK